MPNTEKVSAVAEITEHFSSASAAVITEYRGLTVKQITELRRALGRDTTYAVVKNTLTKRAAAEAGVSIDDSLLQGPTAIAFVKGDPVDAAKGLRDFARTHPLLVIKGGVIEGRALSADEVNRIADLESREVLLAKLAGALKALPTRAASLFQAPLSQVAQLVGALEKKERSRSPVSQSAADGDPHGRSETARQNEAPIPRSFESVDADGVSDTERPIDAVNKSAPIDVDDPTSTDPPGSTEGQDKPNPTSRIQLSDVEGTVTPMGRIIKHPSEPQREAIAIVLDGHDPVLLQQYPDLVMASWPTRLSIDEALEKLIDYARNNHDPKTVLIDMDDAETVEISVWSDPRDAENLLPRAFQLQLLGSREMLIWREPIPRETVARFVAYERHAYSERINALLVATSDYPEGYIRALAELFERPDWDLGRLVRVPSSSP